MRCDYPNRTLKPGERSLWIFGSLFKALTPLLLIFLGVPGMGWHSVGEPDM